MSQPIRIPITEKTQVGDARRSATTLAATLGFSDERRGSVAIVATELATNLARHAKSGEIILRPVEVGKGVLAIEVLAIDRGPGIGNLSEAYRDGYSTSGTPGTGLGAVRRQSNQFDAYSSPAGTVVMARLSSDGQELASRMPLDVGAVCLPLEREVACGDAWYAADTGNGRIMILVADGLGHGIQAAEASRAAVELFKANLHLNTENLVTLLHNGMRSTRGAAVAVVELKRGANEMRFAGVGNISGSLLAEGKSRSTVSHNGTVGAQLLRVKEFIYPWPADGTLILHSDGLKSQWQLQTYRGLQSRHPSVIAGVLYRDYRRERDDVTVVVINASPSVP